MKGYCIAVVAAALLVSGCGGGSFLSVKAPKAQKIVFTRNISGTSDLWSVNLDGTHLKQLTKNSDDNSDASFSPDGSNIIFWSLRGSADSNLFTMQPDGSGQTQLIGGDRGARHPSYSNDGTKIVFDDTSTGISQVFTASANGQNIFNASNSLLEEGNPRFSPDGSKIVFRILGATSALWIMDSNGANKSQIYSAGGLVDMASFNPAGTRIVFGSNVDGPMHIFSCDLNGSNVTRLTNGPDSDQSPVYSPDGTMIAFISNRGGANTSIYVMDADGGNIHAVTSGGNDSSPCWSPVPI